MNETIQRLASYLGSECQCEVIPQGFSIDSRKVQKGDLFFALPGAKVMGVDFLEEAARLGAVAAIVPDSYRGHDFGLELIRVKDVKGALQQLGQIAADRMRGTRIAVTGSVGKTTTKEFLVSLLQSRFRVGYTAGNANSQLSFPLFWLNLKEDCDFFVLEMGMTHEGEIRRLVEISPPDVALITRIAPAHIANFSDGIIGVSRAKAEIFSHPRTKVRIASCQAAAFDEVRRWGVDLLVGEGGDFLMKTEKAGIVVAHKAEDISPLLSPPFQASHLLENLLAAVAVARTVGLSWEDIQRACYGLKPHALRFETEVRDGVTFVKDCYNSNPLSVRAALDNLPAPTGTGRRIGVLGMMAEQGSYSRRHHVEVAEYALDHIDALFCIGGESVPMVEVFLKAGKPAEYIEELPDLKKRLFDSIRAGDVVLIKGSNFLKLWQLMDV